MGIEDEVADIVEKVCKELLGPSVEELQTPSLCLGNSNPPMTEGESFFFSSYTNLVDQHFLHVLFW